MTIREPGLRRAQEDAFLEEMNSGRVLRLGSVVAVCSTLR